MHQEKFSKSLAGLGFETVTSSLTRCGTLRVVIDAPDGVSLADCEQVSRHLEHVLPVEGIVYKALEISSPGPERVLSAPEHFARYVGRQAVLRLRVARGERKTYSGTIAAASVSAVELDCDEGVLAFGYEELAGANLRDTAAKPARKRQGGRPS